MGSVPPTLIGRRTRGDDQRGPMLAPLVARAASRWSGQTGRKTRPCYPSIAAQPVATARSPSKEVLPKRKGLPQNRCYQVPHRKGAPVTEPARREYAAVMRTRYQQANRQERGRLLDEYCRTTGCHRKAAIRRLRQAPRPRRRPAGRPLQYVPHELAAVLEPAWLASDQLSGKLLRPILPALLTALATRHGLRMAPTVHAALTRASAATLDRLLRRCGGVGRAHASEPPRFLKRRLTLGSTTAEVKPHPRQQIDL